MKGRIEAIYDFGSPKGHPRIRKVRRAVRCEADRRFKFRMQSWTVCGDGKGRWLRGIRDDQAAWSLRALYRLPEVIAALKAGEPTYLGEGEKDTDAVQGWLDANTGEGAATSHWQGASTFEHGQAVWFAGYGSKSRVVIVCDNDQPGAYSGWLRYSTLLQAGVDEQRLSVIAPPWGPLQRFKDAYDALSVGLGLDEFRSVGLRSLEAAASAYGATRAARYTYYDGPTRAGARTSS